MTRRWLLLVVGGIWLASGVLAAPLYVPGLVPDWDQPYAYTGISPNGGPGPDPNAGVLDPWNAWCAPTSASNLVGHWDDQYGVGVADGVAFPNSAVNWAVGASWQDYLADGFARPAAGGGVPAAPTDIGYYMDTNNLGMFLGNGLHAGTFLKDIHAGLGTHLTLLQPAAGWTTGTQGRGFAAGLASNGAPAVMHANVAAALAEIVGETNAGRTMIVSWAHWNIVPAGLNPVGGGGQGEDQYQVNFYDFGSLGPDPWGNDESWNNEDGGGGLGHAVTAVGYLTAADPVNPRPGTDWVIVHDNVTGTPRNVAVPLTALTFNIWTANTNAVPEPSVLVLLGFGATLMLRRRTA